MSNDAMRDALEQIKDLVSSPKNSWRWVTNEGSVIWRGVIEELCNAALAAPAQSEATAVTDERNGFDVALNALAEYERNWDTGAEHPYAEMSRIEMEGACEAVRDALNEARAALSAAAPAVEEAQPVTDERAAFEKEFSGLRLTRGANGLYDNPQTGFAWKVWQARAALSTATAPSGYDARVLSIDSLKELRWFVTSLTLPSHPHRAAWVHFIDAAIAAANKGDDHE